MTIWSTTQDNGEHQMMIGKHGYDLIIGSRTRDEMVVAITIII